MRLICKLIDGEELVFEISKPSFVIGRSTQADVVIPHEGMSRKHCLIENKNGQFFITDLESANGVFIDDKRIAPSTPTPVPEYLNLSFGAVQSLRIEQEENLNYKIEQQTKNLQNPLHKTNPNLKRPASKTGKHEQLKKGAPASSSKKNVLLLVATIMVLAIAGYLYYQDIKNQDMPLTPEEMYE